MYLIVNRLKNFENSELQSSAKELLQKELEEVTNKLLLLKEKSDVDIHAACFCAKESKNCCNVFN
jgi:hypothetical protein